MTNQINPYDELKYNIKDFTKEKFVSEMRRLRVTPLQPIYKQGQHLLSDYCCPQCNLPVPQFREKCRSCGQPLKWIKNIR